MQSSQKETSFRFLFDERTNEKFGKEILREVFKEIYVNPRCLLNNFIGVKHGNSMYTILLGKCMIRAMSI